MSPLLILMRRLIMENYLIESMLNFNGKLDKANRKNKLTESYHGSMADALFGILDDDLDQGFEDIIITSIKSVFNASADKNKTFKHLDDKQYCDDYTEYLDHLGIDSFLYDATSFDNPWPANSPDGKLFYDTVKSQCGPLLTIKIDHYGDGRFAYFALTDNVLDYFIKNR